MGDPQEVRPGLPGGRGPAGPGDRQAGRAGGPGPGVNEGELGNWVNADRRRRDGGDGYLSEDERAGWSGCGKRTPSWRWSAMCSNAAWPLGQGRDGPVAVAAFIAAQGTSTVFRTRCPAGRWGSRSPGFTSGWAGCSRRGPRGGSS